MCRNIKTLHNFDPPATDEEIYLSSLQFVRKLSGFTKPSSANQAAFDRAVDKVSRAARELIDSLVTSAPPRDRDVETSSGCGLRATAGERLQGHKITAAKSVFFCAAPTLYLTLGRDRVRDPVKVFRVDKCDRPARSSVSTIGPRVVLIDAILKQTAGRARIETSVAATHNVDVCTHAPKESSC
jgi:hypothetical protein